ncbi:MAG: hypothetical protein M3354_09480 [Chloroflexota bacterium]|nr:hypothetical protein [Chloroflexota bacterium]
MHRSRIWLSTFVLILALAAGQATAAATQDATTTPDLLFADSLGLPELNVTATDETYEGLPAETAAGRYLLSLENAATKEAGIGLMQLPEGVTADDFTAMLAGPPPSAEMASPAAEMTEEEQTGEGEDGPPEWFFTTKQAGGIYSDNNGQTVQAIVDLTPGEWIVWGGDPEAPQPPVGLTVTGEMPADLPEPEAGVTLTLFEYGFTIDGTLTAGPQTIKVANVGAQPHHVFATRAPEGVTLTKEMVGQILELDMQGATPAADSGLPSPDTFIDSFYMTTLSTGSTAWLAVDLAPGSYVLFCFVPDIASGMPHAYEGMYEIVTVGDA